MTVPQREPVVVEDQNNNVVLIDGEPIDGFIDGRLAECLHQRIYAEKYDAYFCAVEDKWLEAICGDPSCDFCRARPENPLPARSVGN